MIASFSNNFIFIKTRKTAGTSVEIVLSSWCTGKDICTPITAEDEVVRAAYGGRPQNYEGNLLSRALKQRPFYNHMPAAKVQKALPALWKEAYKFAVDRHPYEKVVSLAYFNLAGRADLSDEMLSAEIFSVIDRKYYINYPLYTSGDQLLVDELVPYPKIWEWMARLSERVEKPLPAILPTAKSRFRLNRAPADHILSPEQKRNIRQAAAREFELLGWDL